MAITYRLEHAHGAEAGKVVRLDSGRVMRDNYATVRDTHQRFGAVPSGSPSRRVRTAEAAREPAPLRGTPR
jgi:hypothetical protein